MLMTVLGSSVFGQEGETQSPGIGMVSIDAISSETGQEPGKDAATVDFKVVWEPCVVEEDAGEIQWTAEKYQAYFWNTPTFVGDPETTENLPPVGADSSGFIDDLEYVFEGKESNQQSYFMIKGILTGDDNQDPTIVFSPVSMDIFPRPVIMVTLWQRISDWISEKGLRTLVILAIILFLFIIGIYWAQGCFQRQGNGILFPAKNLQPVDIVKEIIGRLPDKSNPGDAKIVEAVSRSLGNIDRFRPSKNGAELTDLPAYRVIEGAVNIFLNSGSTPADIQSTLENQVGIELKELRTDSKVDWIWNTGYVEPLVGLFGTVTGLALAFSSKVADRDTDMYAGIYEALYTTIAGLAAGIVLVLLYNACDHRFHRVEGAFQRLATDLATHLRR
jgi:biopolymer transport protein ExbB/TolQ